MGVFVRLPKRWNVWIADWRTEAKAKTKYYSIDQERRSRERRWSETVVVSTVNDEEWGWEEDWFFFVTERKNDRFRTLWEIKTFCSLGGVYLQRRNLKELTERHHQRWNLRLNSTKHEKLTRARERQDWRTKDSSRFFQKWCMAVFNRWCELSALLR